MDMLQRVILQAGLRGLFQAYIACCGTAVSRAGHTSSR